MTSDLNTLATAASIVMNAFSGALGGKKPGGEKGVYAEYSGEFVLIPTALNILANG